MNDTVTPDAAPTTTAGRLLRQAREAAGLHIATLAVALKVPVRKLEALEEDRYDLLPDAVFVRALASSVCRTLKIDAQPVLDLLPQVATPRLVPDTDGINTPFRPPGERPHQKWPEQISKPVAFTVVALLLGALVLIFMPRTMVEETLIARTHQAVGMPAPGASAAAGAPTAATPPAAAAPALTPAPALATVPAQATPNAGAPGAPMAGTPPTVAAVTQSPAAPGTPAIAASAAPAPDAGGVVTFRTTGDSWVSVTDARGASVLRRMLQAGETASVSGALPLAVTVGSVETTQVQVRGQAFDLKAIARDNVARFEVK